METLTKKLLQKSFGEHSLGGFGERVCSKEEEVERQCWIGENRLEAHPACIPLWHVPGISLPITLHYDMMHSKYLGSDSYLAGSILEFLVSHKLRGSQEANLQEVWCGIVAQCVAQSSPSRFGSMTLTMFQAKKSPFPCLKGKASDVKHLMPALLALCREMLDTDIHIEKVMVAALESSCAIDRCLTENKAMPRWDGELIKEKRHSLCKVFCSWKCPQCWFVILCVLGFGDE